MIIDKNHRDLKRTGNFIQKLSTLNTTTKQNISKERRSFLFDRSSFRACIGFPCSAAPKAERLRGRKRCGATLLPSFSSWQSRLIFQCFLLTNSELLALPGPLSQAPELHDALLVGIFLKSSDKKGVTSVDLSSLP